MLIREKNCTIFGSLNIQHKLIKVVESAVHHPEPSTAPSTDDEIDNNESDINESDNNLGFFKWESNLNTS